MEKAPESSGAFLFSFKMHLKFLFYFYPMQITGIILAGGLSKRMGTDKALIQHNGKTLLENAIEICKPACKSIIISSNNPEHGKYGHPLIADVIQDCGPIGGIYSCLEKSDTDWNFVISVDTPFVTGDFIEFLLLQTGNFDAVIPLHSGKTEPLIALYNKTCLTVMQSQIRLNQFKLQTALALLKTHFIEVDQWLNKTSLLFKNLNRPEDLQ